MNKAKPKVKEHKNKVCSIISQYKYSVKQEINKCLETYLIFFVKKRVL